MKRQANSTNSEEQVKALLPAGIIISTLINEIKHAHQIVLKNFYYGSYECDVFSLLHSGYTHEYEIKVSVSDLQNDLNKTDGRSFKCLDIVQGKRTNKFYYVVPENLVDKQDVPPFAGLIYYREKLPHFKLVKEAKMLHKNKVVKHGLIYNIAVRCYNRYNHVKS